MAAPAWRSGSLRRGWKHPPVDGAQNRIDGRMLDFPLVRDRVELLLDRRQRAHRHCIELVAHVFLQRRWCREQAQAAAPEGVEQRIVVKLANHVGAYIVAFKPLVYAAANGI